MQADGHLKIVVEGTVSSTVRARQVSSMFDAPPEKKCRLEWQLNLDLDSAPWTVGLVVGPSGSGKTTVMRHIWGEPPALAWEGPGAVDCFDAKVALPEIASVCQAVGFNTIPAWLRPYSVLSNGEKFRVELARRLITDADPIVVDEFTSVVDRQVAQIGSHAVQKYVRKNSKRFVAVTCHYDVLDWLQPDWVLDMATRQFQRRLLQRRPSIECVIGKLPHSAWSMFSPYHYMTADLHGGAKCFGLWATGRLAAFAGILPCPISNGPDRGGVVWRVSRLVTLPDWQGLGLAMVLCDALGAEYRAAGKRLRTYPAHPSLVRTFDRSMRWSLRGKPGATLGVVNHTGTAGRGHMGGRQNAVFEYVGPPSESPRLL